MTITIDLDKMFIFVRNRPMYEALPFKWWGRFVQDGYWYVMHVRALLTHPFGLARQPAPTICRGRRIEASASIYRPRSPDPCPVPRPPRCPPADRTATRGHREPATDNAGPGLHLEQI